MPRLDQIAEALRKYQGRYEYLDAFADDIEDLLTLEGTARMIQSGPHPRFILRPRSKSDPERLFVQLFPEQGIARFELKAKAVSDLTDRNATSTAVGGLIGSAVGAAVGAATETKEGLLGGLVLGMLVGGAIGASANVERVLALQFHPSSGEWRLYDGPLLRWAKRALQPAS